MIAKRMQEMLRGRECSGYISCDESCYKLKEFCQHAEDCKDIAEVAFIVLKNGWRDTSIIVYATRIVCDISLRVNMKLRQAKLLANSERNSRRRLFIWQR